MCCVHCAGSLDFVDNYYYIERFIRLVNEVNLLQLGSCVSAVDLKI